MRYAGGEDYAILEIGKRRCALLILAVESYFGFSERYFCSPLPQITSRTFGIPPHKRGVSRSSRTRGGGRWTRQRQARNVMQGGFARACEQSNGELTNDVAAYGEVVWS